MNKTRLSGSRGQAARRRINRQTAGRRVEQQGTAIVLALFVTALAAAISVAILMHVRMQIRKTQLIVNSIQADLYTDGSRDWAIHLLTENLKHQQTGHPVDHLSMESIDHINGATITSHLEDAEALLNLNRVTPQSPLFQDILKRLMSAVMPNIKSEEITEISEGITDWITPGLQNSRFDQYYAKQSPPWQSAHHPMASVSELRMIKGMTAARFRQLAPYVTALPAKEKTAININTAPIPVLAVLSPEMNAEKAAALARTLKQSPVTDIKDLDHFPVVKSASIDQNILTVTSRFFLLKTTVSLGDQQETVYSLLSRTRKDNQVVTGVLWQSKGTL